jgi:hypothetical protein
MSGDEQQGTPSPDPEPSESAGAAGGNPGAGGAAEGSALEPDMPEPPGAADDEVVARLADDRLGSSDRVRLLAELARRMGGGDHAAAVRRAGDVLLRSVSRLRTRDAAALRAAHPGLPPDRIAAAVIGSAARTAGGVRLVTAVAGFTPAPAFAVEAARGLVHALVEIRMIAEMHAAYDRPLPSAGALRASALLRAWATEGIVRPEDSGVPLGSLTRQRLRGMFTEERATGGGRIRQVFQARTEADRMIQQRGSVIAAALSGASAPRGPVDGGGPAPSDLSASGWAGRPSGIERAVAAPMPPPAFPAASPPPYVPLSRLWSVDPETHRQLTAPRLSAGWVAFGRWAGPLVAMVPCCCISGTGMALAAQGSAWPLTLVFAAPLASLAVYLVRHRRISVPARCTRCRLVVGAAPSCPGCGAPPVPAYRTRLRPALRL